VVVTSSDLKTVEVGRVARGEMAVRERTVSAKTYLRKLRSHLTLYSLTSLPSEFYLALGNGIYFYSVTKLILLSQLFVGWR
jgi:hypothetical protein